MKPHSKILSILLIAISTLICGCTPGTGTLADYFGWQSLGGNWRGTVHLSDERDLAFAMTFTEFDGESFHVLVEAGEGADISTTRLMPTTRRPIRASHSTFCLSSRDRAMSPARWSIRTISAEPCRSTSALPPLMEHTT